MERGRVECVFNIVAAISTWLVASIKLHMAASRAGGGIQLTRGRAATEMPPLWLKTPPLLLPRERWCCSPGPGREVNQAVDQKEEAFILAYHEITLKPRGLWQGWNFTIRSTASVDGRMDAT